MNRAKPEISLSDKEQEIDFYNFTERKEWGAVDMTDVELEAPSKYSDLRRESYQTILRKEISNIDEKILTTHSSKTDLLKDLLNLKQSLLLELESLSSPQTESQKICSHCYNRSVFFETSEPFLRCNHCNMPVVPCSSCEVAMAKYYCSLKGACDVCLHLIPNWNEAASYMSFRNMDLTSVPDSPFQKFSKGIEDIDLGTMQISNNEC